MSTLTPMSTLRMNSLLNATKFSVFALIVLISCQDNENINPICGTWTLKGITTLNCKDTRQEATVTFACENSACTKYTFSADGFLRIEQFTNTGTIVTQGTYTFSNEQLLTHIADAQNPTTRTFNVEISKSDYLYLIETFPYGTGKCSATSVFRK
jgi:hypothetical protein